MYCPYPWRFCSNVIVCPFTLFVVMNRTRVGGFMLHKNLKVVAEPLLRVDQYCNRYM